MVEGRQPRSHHLIGWGVVGKSPSVRDWTMGGVGAEAMKISAHVRGRMHVGIGVGVVIDLVVIVVDV